MYCNELCKMFNRKSGSVFCPKYGRFSIDEVYWTKLEEIRDRCRGFTFSEKHTLDTIVGLLDND